jgi:quinol monooxygenase YgiN
MPSVQLYIFVRFDPKPGNEQRLREELLLLLEPTRTEAGCIRMQLYESTREPSVFFVHSQWTDEAAFDAHAQTPHMKRFLGLVDELITHPLQATRTKKISG